MLNLKAILTRLVVSSASTVFFAGVSYAPAVHAQQIDTLSFVTHAAFFSAETQQPKALDPQVFVKAMDAPAATGPQNIKHLAGYRNALLSDGSEQKLFSATGLPLGFTLGEWLGAKGKVVLIPMASGSEKIIAVFTGLRPGGVYSLFENYFDQKPIGFTPLDAQGTGNSFVAGHDGRGAITLVAPHLLTHANAVLLVYHSDHRSHGASRGEIGVTAQHQLIARIP